METVKTSINTGMREVGMREFRDKIATYVMESDAPVAITRHGDTVGYFLPTRRKRTEEEKAALEEAAVRFQEVLQANGLTEDEVLADFELWRKSRNR